MLLKNAFSLPHELMDRIPNTDQSEVCYWSFLDHFKELRNTSCRAPALKAMSWSRERCIVHLRVLEVLW